MNQFEEAEVLFKADPENEAAWAVLPTDEGAWNTFVKVEDEALQVMAYHPLRIPEDTRAALAELIVRIGPRNNMCRLEMDFDRGLLMTRSRLYFDSECGLSEEAIFTTIGFAICALDCVHSAVMAILHQGKTAAEAARMLEEEGESEQELPLSNRFNLPKPEGELPWPELPGEELRNN
ncbi:MAG: hypothetical protein H8E27_09030 [Verrucomicrobia subdivision 3 bacterium]|nr:hypothetical protein [Limisphaerales bacterium]